MKTLRLFDTVRDYPLWADWWEAKKLRPVPRDLLPSVGLTVSQPNGVPICMGFLGTDHGPAAALVNVAGNPTLPPKVRGAGLDRLMQALVDLARQSGYTVICAATNVPALQARYEKLGFFVTDRNVTHYGRTL